MKENMIKCLMVTGSPEDPRNNMSDEGIDQWIDCFELQLKKSYKLEELINMSSCKPQQSLWIYEGPDFEVLEGFDMVYGQQNSDYRQLFYPWDMPQFLSLVYRGEENVK